MKTLYLNIMVEGDFMNESDKIDDSDLLTPGKRNKLRRQNTAEWDVNEMSFIRNLDKKKTLIEDLRINQKE